MIDDYKYLWTEDKNKYVLVALGRGRYSILEIYRHMALIIEDNEIARLVENKMLENGNQILEPDILKEVINGRPMPLLIKTTKENLFYKWPDTGETFSKINRRFELVEPEYDISIVWKDNDMPLLKQVVLLKKLWPQIKIGTPELVDFAKRNNEMVFIRSCGIRILNEVESKSEELGLKIKVTEAY